MVVPQPLALGCISLVLCLLELSHGTALPRGGHRRDTPDQRPLSTASFLEDHLGPQPLALAQPVGTAGHSLKLTPKRLDAPRHRLLAPKVASRHRMLAPKVAPQHRLLVPKVAPRHRLLVPKVAPRHRLLVPRVAPRHRLIVPKVAPQHRLFTPKVAPRRGHRLLLRHGPRGRRHASGHLLRVGCVLGTCQVQNLSHRLWQLMGQSGRQDSSPMNPNSPHSYG